MQNLCFYMTPQKRDLFWTLMRSWGANLDFLDYEYDDTQLLNVPFSLNSLIGIHNRHYMIWLYIKVAAWLV